MKYFNLIKFAESLQWAQNIISKELEMESKRDNFQISDQEYNNYLIQLKQALSIKRGNKTAQSNQKAVSLNMGIYENSPVDNTNDVKFTVGKKTFYGQIKSRHNLYSIVQLMFQDDGNAWRLASGKQNVSNSKLTNFQPSQIPSRLWDMKSGGGI